MILTACIDFCKSTYGLIVRPYETMRRVSSHASYWELLPLGVVLSAYFGTASIVKTASFRPFLLTKQFIVMGSVAALTFGVVTGLVWFVSKTIGGVGTYKSIIIGWGYSMLPTVAWFFATSLLYIVIPPPRTTGVLGMTFSIVFLTFSTVLLLWKIILGYLTLRFGMRLDLWKIIGVVLLSSPAISAYCYILYIMGIWKVPFM